MVLHPVVNGCIIDNSKKKKKEKSLVQGEQSLLLRSSELITGHVFIRPESPYTPFLSGYPAAGGRR
jgi:hypothetical protein